MHFSAPIMRVLAMMMLVISILGLPNVKIEERQLQARRVPPDERHNGMQCHTSTDTMEDGGPPRPQWLTVRARERVSGAVWQCRGLPDNSDSDDLDLEESSFSLEPERLWGHLIRRPPESGDLEDIFKVEFEESGNLLPHLEMYGDLTADVLYTAPYEGVHSDIQRQGLKILIVEAWRELRNNPRQRMRKIVVPIKESPTSAREFEFDSALGSLDAIRPTDQSDWRTLSNTEHRDLFRTLMARSLGRIITDGAAEYGGLFVGRSPAEVKWIRLLLPARGKVKTDLPIEAFEFSFEATVW